MQSGARRIRAPLFADAAFSPILWYHKTSDNLVTDHWSLIADHWNHL